MPRSRHNDSTERVLPLGSYVVFTQSLPASCSARHCTTSSVACKRASRFVFFTRGRSLSRRSLRNGVRRPSRRLSNASALRFWHSSDSRDSPLQKQMPKHHAGGLRNRFSGRFASSCRIRAFIVTTCNYIRSGAGMPSAWRPFAIVFANARATRSLYSSSGEPSTCSLA